MAKSSLSLLFQRREPKSPFCKGSRAQRGGIWQRLDAEKLVTRRVRRAAVAALGGRDRGAPHISFNADGPDGPQP